MEKVSIQGPKKLPPTKSSRQSIRPEVRRYKLHQATGRKRLAIVQAIRRNRSKRVTNPAIQTMYVKISGNESSIAPTIC